MATEAKDKGSKLRQKWERLITVRQKDLRDFQDAGDVINNTYRIEKRNTAQRDKYNILFSNVETIRPSLYAKSPKVEVERTEMDHSNPIARAACEVLETVVDYQLREQRVDFDTTMKDVVQDNLLPGFGQIWLRYVPTMMPLKSSEGEPVLDEQGQPEEEVAYESVQFDYVYWKDFLWSKGRRWGDVWWVARRSWMDRDDYKKRFGQKVASLTTFTSTRQETAVKNADEEWEAGQACVWEIWDRKSRKRIMFCETYNQDVLEQVDDPLRLEGFFPCPPPLFAISTTSGTIPRPYYAQYQAQADELNDITCRIRLLVDALRVIGVYDASVPALKDLLTGSGNKMIPVEGWSTIAEKGGLKGTVDFLPIAEIANTLMQLYDARERVKGEIYEITGWSDVIRGVSKASETLGAQQLKSDWASSRLKLQQKDVQRFIRDAFRICGEIISEHFQPTSIALMCGIDYMAETDEMKQLFGQVIQLLRSQKERCAMIRVETDSTLMPDEQKDKQERMEFVGAAGAFLQQAVPAMQTMPQMGPLLASILMFAVRGFRGARTLEQQFEQFIQGLQSGQIQPPQQPGKEGQGGGTDPAVEQSKVQVAMQQVQQKAQADQVKASTDQAKLAMEDQHHAEDIQLEREKEMNRHAEKMRELDIKSEGVRQGDAELALKANADQRADTEQALGASERAEDRAADQHFRQRDADRADKSENSSEGD